MLEASLTYHEMIESVLASYSIDDAQLEASMGDVQLDRHVRRRTLDMLKDLRKNPHLFIQ